METITKNSLFKDVYNTKEIIIATIMAAAGGYLLIKYQSIIGLVGFILGLIRMSIFTKIALMIDKDKFHIIKQQVRAIKDLKVSLDVGEIETPLAVDLHLNDSIYIVYEGASPVMVYNTDGVKLSKPIAHHLLSDRDTERFIKIMTQED